MSIYDSIGGASAVEATVDEFYKRVLADPALAPYFAGLDMQHIKSHQRAFIAATVGGAEIFGGRSMALAHAGLKISDSDFDTVVAHLVDSLTSLGVPDSTIGEIGAALLPLRKQIVHAPPRVPATR